MFGRVPKFWGPGRHEARAHVSTCAESVAALLTELIVALALSPPSAVPCHVLFAQPGEVECSHRLKLLTELPPKARPVLRVFPPRALISHAQGSSSVVDNMPFARRGHTKSLTTRARPSPDLAVWLE